ncbi:MAG: polysaccharide deacetylase family protein [Pseudomonadota bacterium]
MSLARAVPVLMYHHVSPRPGLVTVSPETFAAQMEYLAAAGYTALTADDFLGFLLGQRQVPEKSVLITFDDGYLDNYVHAYPVLKRLGLHAVIFVVTGWIGEGPARSGQALPCPDHKACKAAIAAGRADEVMLRWSEIEEMEASGAAEFHSHTHSHIRWDKESPVGEHIEQMEADLMRSQAELRRRLGKESPHLCWPWGYFEPEYQNVAREMGFSAQYTVDKGVNIPGTDPARIRRMVVKDRAGAWFARRLWIYSRPLLGCLYLRLRGE